MSSKQDLPKVDSTVECQFPGQDFKVKCKILSKAGKASAANWHYLNVQEGEGAGKCCDFKDVLWRRVDDSQDEQLASNGPSSN